MLCFQRQSNYFILSSHCSPSIQALRGVLWGCCLDFAALHSSSACCHFLIKVNYLFSKQNKCYVAWMNKDSTLLPWAPCSSGLGGIYGRLCIFTNSSLQETILRIRGLWWKSPKALRISAWIIVARMHAKLLVALRLLFTLALLSMKSVLIKNVACTGLDIQENNFLNSVTFWIPRNNLKSIRNEQTEVIYMDKKLIRSKEMLQRVPITQMACYFSPWPIFFWCITKISNTPYNQCPFRKDRSCQNT